MPSIGKLPVSRKPKPHTTLLTSPDNIHKVKMKSAKASSWHKSSSMVVSKKKVLKKRLVSNSSFSSEERMKINESCNDEFLDLTNKCVGCGEDYDNTKYN